MTKILMIAMAEFSYFLEKHLGCSSILPTVLFIAMICAMICAFSIQAVCNGYTKVRKQAKQLKYQPFYLTLALGISFFANRLIATPQVWNSKVHRVMSNCQYVLSFQANRKPFFDALSIPDTTVNQNKVFEIIMSLNDRQWEAVNEAAGDVAWYFAKVEKAITETLRLGAYHLSIPVYRQSVAAFLPCVLMVVLGVLLFQSKRKLEGTCVILAAVIGIWFSLGGSIFLCVMAYVGYLSWMYASWVVAQRQKRQIAKQKNKN